MWLPISSESKVWCPHMMIQKSFIRIWPSWNCLKLLSSENKVYGVFCRFCATDVFVLDGCAFRFSVLRVLERQKDTTGTNLHSFQWNNGLGKIFSNVSYNCQTNFLWPISMTTGLGHCQKRILGYIWVSRVSLGFIGEGGTPAILVIDLDFRLANPSVTHCFRKIHKRWRNTDPKFSSLAISLLCICAQESRSCRRICTKNTARRSLEVNRCRAYSCVPWLLQKTETLVTTRSHMKFG